MPALLGAIACLSGIVSAQAPTEKGRLGLTLTQITAPWLGDLDGMAERRMIRVLTRSAKPSTSSTVARHGEPPTIKASCSKRN